MGKNKFRAKNISKIGMVISALIAISYNCYNLIINKKIPTLQEQKSILLLSGYVLICFSPIYINIIIDKFVKKYKGGL
jgi:hypothetical protein